MKPIQEHKDPGIANLSFDTFTGSIYIIDPRLNEETISQSMLTSPRTNSLVPSHHLALITQPVLGARSRSRKKTTNIILQTSTKDKRHSMSNTRRISSNDSPPLIIPINRIDTLQYQKHDSSDSGLDLSLSTNSSVQLQHYSQQQQQQQQQHQHISIHRPLSALNEDSSPDDGYDDDHHEAPPSLDVVRLRLPPVSLGRNRSMEDILNHNSNTREKQHRSSSFTDERQYEQKMKRSSDGLLLDLAPDIYQRVNINLNPSPTQQYRSFNDLTNRTSNRVLGNRNDSTMSTIMNNLPTPQTIIRKPNISTLKPLRKKTKLNIFLEPSIPLTSSRLAIYDEQLNPVNGTTSSSSNQTTPRSIRPVYQQQQHQMKSKTLTPMGHYPNQEQIRAHVSRSVVERQHPPVLPAPSRRGVIQQMIPFDASPSKVNNLFLRHHVQQHQPTTIFHPSSNNHLSPSRQVKQTLPVLYDDNEEEEEISGKIQEDKRKQRERIPIDKVKEFEERKRSKERDQSKLKVKTNQESILSQRHHLTSIPKHDNHEQEQPTEKISPNTLHHQYEQRSTRGHFSLDNRKKQTSVNDSNPGKYQSSQTIQRTVKPEDNNRRQQNIRYTPESVLTNRSNVENGKKPAIHQTKPTEFFIPNKTQTHSKETNLNRVTESTHHHSGDSSSNTQLHSHATFQSLAPRTHPQIYETLINRPAPLQTQIDQYSKNGNEKQSSNVSVAKSIRVQPIQTNLSDVRNRLSDTSKADSIAFKAKSDEKTFHGTSPTSWSILSPNPVGKRPTYQSEMSTSSPSSIEDHYSAQSRTYRLLTDNQGEQSPLPNGSSPMPSSHASSSRQTHPFKCTSDLEKDSETFSQAKPKSVLFDHRSSPSPLMHLPSKKKLYSPPPPVPTKEHDETTSNYDSDDGWSDDSAELLYVDERYAKDISKLTPTSHLPSQQHHHYQIHHQNVLLQ